MDLEEGGEVHWHEGGERRQRKAKVVALKMIRYLMGSQPSSFRRALELASLPAGGGVLNSLKAVDRLLGQSGEEGIAVIKPRQHERVDECLCGRQIEEMADAGDVSEMEES